MIFLVMEFTTTPIEASSVTSSPEFVDSKGMRQMFGISRTAAYDLINDGLIKSVSLRRKGRARGRRLYDVASVREYLMGCYDSRESGNQEVAA
jgi:hypothetical protein